MKTNYENLLILIRSLLGFLDLKSFKIINANIGHKKKYGYSLDDFLKMSLRKLKKNNS
jgi:hypothetical protein